MENTPRSPSALFNLARLLLIFAGAAAPGALRGQIGNVQWDQPVAKDSSEPAWLDQGVVFVGNWEPLAFLLRRGGGLAELPADIEDQYREERTEKTVRELKAGGVNLVITHFYKTGLASDAEDIEVTRKFTALCHRYGIKVGAYIGGTLFAEMLLRDVPEAKQWISRDENGTPVPYGNAPYRYLPDFNHPGYVRYMKQVIRVAVKDLGVDLIHFDNMSQPPPPRNGNTPEINRRFRAFLASKYSPAQLKSRFGFSDLRTLSVPGWQGIAQPTAMAPINDPVIQEWIDFRCQDFSEYYAQLADYIRQLNPKVAVELNPAGVFGANRAFQNGIDHARLLPHGSIFWSEEPNAAKITPEGVLVSKIRSFKLAHTLDQTMFSYTGAERSDPDPGSFRLLMAESMAFNRNCLGDVGQLMGKPLDTSYWTPLMRHYIRFYHDQNRHYSAMRTVADAAILRSFPSIANNGRGALLQTTLMEQMLIQYKIPFDIIFDQNLADLSKYRVLLLADQDALSNRAVAQIEGFVRGGGGLVATGQTSLLNEWRRRRNDYGLSAVLGIHCREDGSASASARSVYGQGRAAYVPSVIPGDGLAPGAISIPNSNWKLPKNSAELIAALRYAAGREFAVEFGGAPLSTVMELTDRTDGSERVLHWVNFKMGAPASPSAVTLAIPAGKRVTAVELISPDRPAASLDFAVSRGRLEFTLPKLEVYNAAVIHLQ